MMGLISKVVFIQWQLSQSMLLGETSVYWEELEIMFTKQSVKGTCAVARTNIWTMGMIKDVFFHHWDERDFKYIKHSKASNKRGTGTYYPKVYFVTLYYYSQVLRLVVQKYYDSSLYSQHALSPPRVEICAVEDIGMF